MNRTYFRIPGFAFFVMLFVLTAGTRKSEAGLIAYYPFDGNGNDASGNGYNLNLYGGVGFAPGLFGQALNLPDDNSQYAARPGSDAAFDFGSANFTISIWANFNSTATEQTLIEKYTQNTNSGLGWSLAKLSDNGLRFVTSFADQGLLNSAPLTITTGVWHDIVVRRDGSNWTMDFDGSVVATAVDSDAIVPSPNPLLVGRRVPDVLGQVFPVNGRLDEAAIWNSALSDADVAKLWNGGTGTHANMIIDSVPEPSGIVLLLVGLIVAGGSSTVQGLNSVHTASTTLPGRSRHRYWRGA